MPDFVSPDWDDMSTSEIIDEAYLTQLLQKIGYTGVRISAFSREQISGSSFGGGQIHRFRLNLSDQASVSVILKETRSINSQALDLDFVRREIDCYQHDLFNGLTKLIVPTAYHVVCRPAINQYWLWLEDFEDAFSVTWTPMLLANAVRDLSELHAVWWGRDDALRSRRFLRQQAHMMYAGLWTDRIKTNCASIDGNPNERLIRRVFTEGRCALLIRLSDQAQAIYTLLDRLPQTLLHHDIWLPNLGCHNSRTVLIDWSYVGRGTAGSELSQAVALLLQAWGAEMDDDLLLQALYDGLTEDWHIPVSYEALRAGYELGFCTRPAHALGGPILGRIISGHQPMLGSSDIEARLASAEATFTRIECGIQRT